MVRINLLPLEIKEARRRRRSIIRMISGLGIVAALFLAAFGLMLAETWNLNRQHEDLVAERRQLQAEVQRYLPYEALQAEARAKEHQVISAMGELPNWTRHLRVIGNRIPRQVWLTEMRMIYAPSNGEAGLGLLNLQGFTYNHPYTATWLESIQAMEGMQDSRVVFSAVATHQNYQLIRFEMNSRIQPGDPYDPFEGRGE